MVPRRVFIASIPLSHEDYKLLVFRNETVSKCRFGRLYGSLTAKRSNTLHYIFHGCHHKHPSDRLRLVFPPVAASILAFPLFVFFRCLLSGPVTMAVFGGGLLGYIHYDLTHYYLHHGSPRDKVVKERKMYHMRHHFKMQSHGFGITSKFWDRMFGTVIPERKS